MLTEKITLATNYGQRSVEAMRSEDGLIKIYTEREIPTPDDQPVREWFNDILSVGYDLEDARCTTTYSGAVVMTGFREAEPWELEQLEAHFPNFDDDEC